MARPGMRPPLFRVLRLSRGRCSARGCCDEQAERHRATQLKEAALDLIAAKPAETMATQGWQQLGTEPDLLQVRKHTTGHPCPVMSRRVLTAECAAGAVRAQVRRTQATA